MPSEAVNEMTRKEWRELGFFYDRDDTAKEWCLIGSPKGLLKFARILHGYASNPKNDMLSEHDHLGPYMYLEIGTWSEPVINDHWIAGPLKSLLNLSTFIEESIGKAKNGDVINLRKIFSPTSPYELILHVRDVAFDPVSLDQQL